MQTGVTCLIPKGKKYVKEEKNEEYSLQRT